MMCMWTYAFLVYAILKEGGKVTPMERLSGGRDTPHSRTPFIRSYTYFFYKSIHGVNPEIID